ncbi:MAG: NERD domain-containing protein [Chloroflexota bacterium]
MGIEAIFKGWMGELKTKFINFLFLDEQYRVFNNVIIPSNNGTTQIDHVIVSKYGIFSVETKDKTGWIFGDPHQEEWTQVIYNKKFQFQNPLRQNYRHTKTLSEFLGLEHDKIHSLIIFWGNCEFKNPMPDNVFKGGVFDSKYKKYIQSKTATLLSTDEILRIYSCLTDAQEKAGFLGGLHHTRDLKNRYDSTTICPKCGGNLVKRVSNRGQRIGKPFLGCSNYPRRYNQKVWK